MAIDWSHAHGRGVIPGLAFFLLVAGTVNASAASDKESLSEITQRLFQNQSFILIEYPNRPARLLLLSESTESLRLTPTQRELRQALLDLTNLDEEVREEAILRLADSDAKGALDLIVSALEDPSPDVRDTAATVLEDLTQE